MLFKKHEWKYEIDQTFMLLILNEWSIFSQQFSVAYLLDFDIFIAEDDLQKFDCFLPCQNAKWNSCEVPSSINSSGILQISQKGLSYGNMGCRISKEGIKKKN